MIFRIDFLSHDLNSACSVHMRYSRNSGSFSSFTGKANSINSFEIEAQFFGTSNQLSVSSLKTLGAKGWNGSRLLIRMFKVSFVDIFLGIDNKRTMTKCSWSPFHLSLKPTEDISFGNKFCSYFFYIRQFLYRTPSAIKIFSISLSE